MAGACWLPVVYLLMKMREMAVEAVATGTNLPGRYFRFFHTWFALGVPAFAAMLAYLSEHGLEPRERLSIGLKSGLQGRRKRRVALAAELVDRFGPLPEEVENLLQVVSLKRACREAGVERLEAGPKGMVLSFRGNTFGNPAGLIAWLGAKGRDIRLRPDHKLAMVREMSVAERTSAARDILRHLVRLTRQARAA